MQHWKLALMRFLASSLQSWADRLLRKVAKAENGSADDQSAGESTSVRSSAPVHWVEYIKSRNPSLLGPGGAGRWRSFAASETAPDSMRTREPQVSSTDPLDHSAVRSQTEVSRRPEVRLSSSERSRERPQFSPPKQESARPQEEEVSARPSLSRRREERGAEASPKELTPGPAPSRPRSAESETAPLAFCRDRDVQTELPQVPRKRSKPPDWRSTESSEPEIQVKSKRVEKKVRAPEFDGRKPFSGECKEPIRRADPSELPHGEGAVEQAGRSQERTSASQLQIEPLSGSTPQSWNETASTISPYKSEEAPVWMEIIEGNPPVRNLPPEEPPWPDLPREPAPEVMDEWAILHRELERQRRLDLEQEGKRWSVWHF